MSVNALIDNAASMVRLRLPGVGDGAATNLSSKAAVSMVTTLVCIVMCVGPVQEHEHR